jgi:hypothetical protein
LVVLDIEDGDELAGMSTRDSAVQGTPHRWGGGVVVDGG